MNRRSLSLVVTAGALGLLLPQGISDANATIMCTGPTSCISTLDFSNLTGLATGNFGTVNIALTSPTTATITFTAATGFAFVDSNVADVNVGASSFTFTPTTAGLSATGSGQVDGFGVFNETSTIGNASNPLSTISFTLTDTSGTWSSASQVLVANSGNWDAAAHIIVQQSGPSSGLTGFAAECASAACTAPPPPAVPEPASLVLLGSALAGLGFFSRRRRQS